ncbi:hypothetical protein EOA13_08755 [Mesorhizobium sp. M7A.F.Ca.US.011.01.1.1]|uniref:hypothetical protein n=1 Tax=Mesorhizobium sp. M7A.F.Ca.US.011.01.1.1 TaxID=2496741 RepID=UPI000FCC5FF9|nr:hypothetical protein [Mesorhizobium sp. M7A.F.Ca.US.011.01.1.1]RUX30484.1 hypothetical protein EOA13_08755 [Mesorhizobium sp. M7A.F.Ca.US.011.01.1.1]
MKQAALANELTVVDSRLMKRVLYGFAVLALLSAAISLAGKWFGHSIAMAGYTDDATVHQVVIGNNVITVPANAIRFAQARRDGIASRLDLYLRYPRMDGYSEPARNDFNHTGTVKNIVFLSFEQQMMSRDMSGRFAPIYSALITRPGIVGPGGTMIYGFNEKSGYLNEVLVVGNRPGKEPFVARCLSGPSADQSLAPCERDIQVGDELSLTYRFPREFLGDWQALDAAIATEATRVLKTGH